MPRDISECVTGSSALQRGGDDADEAAFVCERCQETEAGVSRPASCQPRSWETQTGVSCPTSCQPRSCKSRRKSPCPRASAPRVDKTFKGVVFKFKTVLHSGKPCLLVDTSYRRLPRNINDREATIEERDTLNTLELPSRKCASCSTRRTALWRGTEDGTTLCNACGIRYRKYRIRCRGCWLVPTRDNQGFASCPRCAQTLR